MNKKIGQKIRMLRKQRSLTLEDLSHLINISKSALQRIENGESSSWANHIDQLCQVLHIPIEELFIDKEEEHRGLSVGPFVTGEELLQHVNDLFKSIIREKDNQIKDLEERIKTLDSSQKMR